MFNTLTGTSKTTFAQKAMVSATKLAQAAEELAQLESVYNDRLYGPGATNAIADQDIAGLGIDADLLYGLMILSAQLAKFMNNDVPAVSDYSASLNKLRSDM